MKARTGWLFGGALVLTLGMAAVQAQEKSALLRHSFDENEGGWTAFGEGAKVLVTTDAAKVKEGKGALQYDYAVAKGGMSAIFLPVEEGALAKARAIRFWIKTDHTTPAVFALQERGGGRYVALFTAPKDKWQLVELSLSDFILSEGNDDPKDPNNRLDADQLESLGVLDLAHLFAQVDNEALLDLFNVKTGAHTLYLDELAISEEMLPNAFSSVNGSVNLDRFVRPQLSWIVIGDVRPSRSSGTPLEGQGLQVDYRMAPGKIVGLAKPVPKGSLTGTDKLSFSVAAAKATKLVVQVEEQGGGKYNTIIDVPGESTLQQISLAFADFNPAQDSNDSNGRLDLDRVTQVAFLDPTGLLGGANQENTLWINNLRAAAK